jgi:hypothetical protein
MDDKLFRIKEINLHYLALCKNRDDYTPEMVEPELTSALNEIINPPNTPEIVCLCGSTKFGEAFRQAAFEETLAGRIVLTIGCNMKSDDDLFGNMAEPARQAIKKQLDALHLRKIDMANQVLILNVGGYIGESTKRELDYAKENHKAVRFLEYIGAPNIRDPELPCDEFEPIGTIYGKDYSGNCETDGHYMCAKCVNREPFKPLESE